MCACEYKNKTKRGDAPRMKPRQRGSRCGSTSMGDPPVYVTFQLLGPESNPSRKWELSVVLKQAAALQTDCGTALTLGAVGSRCCHN